MQIYTIKDEKAGIFNYPFTCRHQAEATRMLGTMAVNPKTDLFLYPEDFSLYYLGEYDEKTAKYNLINSPEFIAGAKQLQRKELINQNREEK